jgi:RNA polymerase sigma factor (sigma-70 family)
MAHRVLVVDDEIAIVEGLTALLEWEKIGHADATDYATAAAIIAEEFFPVAITDLRLHTEEEGLRLLDAIRERSPRTRIVVLSGYITQAMENDLLANGVSLVLRKPAMSDEILDAVQTLLEEIEKEAPAGEPVDLEALYLTVRKKLYSIPRHRFNLPHDRAEDVLQEAWLLFLEKRGLIRLAGPWLAGTVANLSRQHLDQRKRRPQTDDDPAEVFEKMVDVRGASLTDRISIEQALSRVDERTRMLCELIGLEGLSYDEVSAATGLPLGSIGPLYIRAKRKLRDVLSH